MVAVMHATTISSAIPKSAQPKNDKTHVLFYAKIRNPTTDKSFTSSDPHHFGFSLAYYINFNSESAKVESTEQVSGREGRGVRRR